MFKPKNAFTLIELLVVIAIIGLLATISVIALNNARAKARDAKRVADVKQIQTALELFFNDENRYPTAAEFNSGSISSYSSSTNSTTTYMAQIPTAAAPTDGSCSDSQNQFIYNSSINGASYTISYCIGNVVGSLAAGIKCATTSGTSNIDCSAGPVSDCSAGDISLACPHGLTSANAGCDCGGGSLFYVYTGTNEYFIAAPAGWYNGVADPVAPWGCSGTLLGASGTTAGTGRTNTATILAGCSVSGIAAQLAHNYNGNGYTDWFLPSKDELSQMYVNLKTAGLGGFENENYLSSSEYDDINVWSDDFSSGGQGNDWNNGRRDSWPRRVRPVRMAVY